MIATLLAAVALQTSAPAFEFRQVTSTLTFDAAIAADVVNPRERYSAGCRESEYERKAITLCPATQAFVRQGVAGQDIFNLSIGFDDTAVAVFDMTLLQEDVPAVLAAFTVKFGEPCEVNASTIGNALGGEFDQMVTTWCLADGRLELRKRNDRNLQRGQAFFVASRFAERAPPAAVVDF